MSLKFGIAKQKQIQTSRQTSSSKWTRTNKEYIGGSRVEGGGVWEVGEGCQKVQTSSYKINKSWKCNLQHGDYN